jgi:hypothetical protein
MECFTELFQSSNKMTPYMLSRESIYGPWNDVRPAKQLFVSFAEESWAKSVATRSVAVWLHLYPAKLMKGGLGEKP